MSTQPQVFEEGDGRYYNDYGIGCDAIVRCNLCHTIVTSKQIQAHGACKCGSRKVREIISLGLFEWAKIRLGILDFPHRKKFLKEFPLW